MALVSISEAARLTGKSRKTIHTYVTSGKVTKVTDTQGRPKIDTSELIRVFGDIRVTDSKQKSQCNFSQEVTPETVTQKVTENHQVEVLKKEIEMLRELIAEKDKRNDDLKHALLLIESKLPKNPEPAPEPQPESVTPAVTETVTPVATKKSWLFWRK